MQEESIIRELLTEQFAFGNRDAIPDDHASLNENGVVDSAGVLSLILTLEERFGIVIEDGDVHPDNLDSVNRIAEFVRTRRAVAQGLSE
jgi:acyl carrier protein